MPKPSEHRKISLPSGGTVGVDLFGNALREKMRQAFSKTFSNQLLHSGEGSSKMYKKGDADSSATVYEDASAVFVQGSQANETPKPHERVISHKRDKTTEPPASGRKFIGEWELGKTIGEGSSGKVKLAKHRTTGEMCVVKAVRRPKLSNGQTASEAHVNSMDSEALAKVYKRELYMIREATLGIMLNHPHLVKLYSAVLGENHFYCFFEFVQGEDLVDYITRTGPIPERQARKIFRKVLSAVEFTHRNHVVHRDIKLENVRYNEQTEEVKVLDFGFATFYQSNFLETNCGSPCYAAPEIYDNKPYIGTASDIWSLGVCLFGMATGTLPFDGNDFRTLAAKVRSGKVTYPAFLCDDLVQLISMMLKTNPRQRATLGQVMEHQWVNRGFKFPPYDYLEFTERPREPMVDAKWVEKLLKSNMCDMGCTLMAELKHRMPTVKIQAEIDTQKVEKDYISTESIKEQDDVRMQDKGRVWWRRLMKNISKLHNRVTSFSGRTSVHENTPILTRLLRRRVATASAFQTQRIEPAQVQPLNQKEAPVVAEQQTSRIRTETALPSKTRWLPRSRFFQRK